MATTSKWGLPVPDQLPAGTGPDVPADIKALGDAVDAKLTPYDQGLLADRPAYGKVGRRYRDENSVIWLDIGSAWIAENVPANGSIGTAKLADGSVTTVKLADDAVTSGKILDGEVGSGEIAAKAVTSSKLADALKPSTGAAAGDEALRALGTTAGTAAAGNDNRLNGSVPIGGMVDYAGSSDPNSQWLFCDGRALSRSTYAALFSAIGTAYGAGDGTTTFNIPDYAGRVSVAPDDMGRGDMGRLSANQIRGAVGGEEKHALTLLELPSGTLVGFTNGVGYDQFTSAAGGTNVRVTSNAAPGHNNMQPFLVSPKIIRVL